MERPHHPVFGRFVRWEGAVPPGAYANWLGQITPPPYATWYLTEAEPKPQGGFDRPALPDLDNEEYPEWIDLLEAVCAAGERFTMVELGAGWGRWLVNGVFAYRQLHPDGAVCLIGVEAEPIHFRWLAEHLEENGIDLAAADLIEAAVADAPGRVIFDVGDPLGCWGQSSHGRATWRTRFQRQSGQRAVRAITLAQTFRSAPGLIDLVDLDVQGAEAAVLTAGAGELDRVRRVHINTHSAEAEGQLRSLFTSLGWDCRTDYSSGSVASTTWWGGMNVSFQDGAQSWLNPRL
jgi:FkbM family methyltransferase